MWQRWVVGLLLAGLLCGAPVAEAGGLAQWVGFGRDREKRLIWIPLDSRPVNTSEVELFGAAAGERVMLPPTGLLDWYADRRAEGSHLLDWWRRTARKQDTVLFYTNTLLAGGLIASRDPNLYADLDQRLALLGRSLRRLPGGRRIAVHVLPRAWPTQFQADGSPSPDGLHPALLLERTALQHRLFLFGDPADRVRLASVEQAIPQAVRQRQDKLLAYHRQILRTLLDWAAAGQVDEVIVGLDDTQPYGMVNLLQRQFEAELRARGLVDRVQVHYGADEIGFLLIAQEALRRQGLSPRIQVTYDRAGAERLILPYEGVTLGESVAQKLALLGAVQGTPGQHLFLHTEREDTASRRLLERMAAADRRGEGIALADVTSAGERDRALVERLAGRVSLDRVAYAGWNTASNTLGTVLAQAALRELYAHSGASEAQRMAWRSFQAIRYANDLHFQAHRVELTRWAAAQGIDPSHFGPDATRMTQRLQRTVLREARAWLARYTCVDAEVCLRVSSARFPWERTFEAEFRPSVESSSAIAAAGP